MRNRKLSRGLALSDGVRYTQGGRFRHGKCLNKYGRVIHPHVRDIAGTFKAEHEIYGRDALHNVNAKDVRLAD